MAKLDFSNSPNANVIKNVQEKSVKNVNTKVIQNLPLELIDENPDNIQIFNMDEIKRLSETIDKDGFYGAIEVYQKENGRYEISSGHRRYRAVKLLKWKTIPAIICPMTSEIEKRHKLVMSNINSRNMKPMDYARAISYQRDTYYMEDALRSGKTFNPGETTEEGKRRYKPSKGFDVAEKLEEDFDLSKAQIMRYLSLLKLTKSAQNFVDSGKTTVSAIFPLAQLDPQIQDNIINELEHEHKILSTRETERYRVDEKKSVEDSFWMSSDEKIPTFLPIDLVKRIINKHVRMDNYNNKAETKPYEVNIVSKEKDISDKNIFSEKDDFLPKNIEETQVTVPLENILKYITSEIENTLQKEIYISDKNEASSCIAKIEKGLNELKKLL